MSLLKKLLEIQKSVDGFVADAQGDRYKYISGSQVLKHIRPLMNKYGVLLKQEVTEINNSEVSYKTRYGDKTEILSMVMQKFTWIDVETGEREECLFGANGKNDYDKGLGSALTYAERYFLLKFFHVPTDEDDVDKPKNQTTGTSANQTNQATGTSTKKNPARPYLIVSKNGEVTPAWVNILKGISAGKISSPEDVEKYYTLTGDVKKLVEKAILENQG